MVVPHETLRSPTTGGLSRSLSRRHVPYSHSHFRKKKTEKDSLLLLSPRSTVKFSGMPKDNKLQKSDMIYQSPASHKKAFKKCLKKKLSKVPVKDWDSATCSVCLEFPHKAVLLLCSSYNKGCLPYMCATGRRLSNCLEQYVKACRKAASSDTRLVDRSSLISGACPVRGTREVPELLCPLCRGQVKGYTVVEQARKYLNRKKRACMQERCSFSGSYRKLKKHVKKKHLRAQTRLVDPLLEEKWKKLVHERDQNDVINTIMSWTPGAYVVGDYVVEPHYYSSDDNFDDHPGIFDGNEFVIHRESNFSEVEL